MDKNCVIEIKNLSKRYRLGEIGALSLRRDLQSRWARFRGKPDPNLPIGISPHKKGDSFLALDNISLTVNRGERVGIIGANGAGKSTLLKLLSRVTSPTEGQISYRGRITGMLEVGAGFHAELTGRENIFLKGAILGMSKAETARKLEQIIAFSECEQFIDTPVKRYSSGMFVKLAFSVAAHLDSEIILMDEILAVGDMRFQKKCIEKMRSLALDESRTVLYVSHNMNTVRSLCSRAVVLDGGKIAFDGEVETAVSKYLGSADSGFFFARYDKNEYFDPLPHRLLRLQSAKYVGKTDNLFSRDEPVLLELCWKNLENINSLSLRVEISDAARRPVTSLLLDDFCAGRANSLCTARFRLELGSLAPGGYYTRYVFFTRSAHGGERRTAESAKGLSLRKKSSAYPLWQPSWGSAVIGKIELLSSQNQ